MNHNLTRLSLLLISCLGLLALAACPQQSGGGGTATTTSSAGGGSPSGGTVAPAKPGALTYTAVLTYRNAPDRGQAEDVQIYLCEGYPLTREAEGRPNDIYYSIKYYDAMKAWTGMISNELGDRLAGAKEMQNVLLTITLSDGREYTWRPHDGNLGFGAGEGVNIPAPELLGK